VFGSYIMFILGITGWGMGSWCGVVSKPQQKARACSGASVTTDLQISAFVYCNCCYSHIHSQAELLTKAEHCFQVQRFWLVANI
jgi:hypothetical protein